VLGSQHTHLPASILGFEWISPQLLYAKSFSHCCSGLSNYIALQALPCCHHLGQSCYSALLAIYAIRVLFKAALLPYLLSKLPVSCSKLMACICVCLCTRQAAGHVVRLRRCGRAPDTFGGRPSCVRGAWHGA